MFILDDLLVGASIASSVAGGVTSIFGAQKTAGAQQQITEGEQQIEAQKQQAMELDARRKQIETIRKAQTARAMALTTAASQGAQYGSGLQGAYGNISGQTGVNLLGINQNLEIGRNIFGLNSQISQAKLAMGEGQSMSALGAGISNLGNNVLGSMDKFNRLSQGGFTGPTNYLKGLFG